MSTLKWIAGFIGWAAGGPVGALIGVLIASFAERGMESIRLLGAEGSSEAPRQNIGQRNSFLLSLMVLSSSVIRADGKVLQSELDYVKDFIRKNFGEAAVDDATKVLNELKDKDINIYSVGSQIASNMNYSQRLQLFHYLVGIATADGDFCKEEKSVLESIAAAIQLSSSDSASIIAMFYRDKESAYAVLEISPSATNDEVKSAYRRMAMKNHPDKVATLGPDVQKAAEEKFRKIQEAYELIKKERNIN